MKKIIPNNFTQPLHYIQVSRVQRSKHDFTFIRVDGISGVFAIASRAYWCVCVCKFESTRRVRVHNTCIINTDVVVQGARTYRVPRIRRTTSVAIYLKTIIIVSTAQYYNLVCVTSNNVTFHRRFRLCTKVIGLPRPFGNPRSVYCTVQFVQQCSAPRYARITNRKTTEQIAMLNMSKYIFFALPKTSVYNTTFVSGPMNELPKNLVDSVKFQRDYYFYENEPSVVFVTLYVMVRNIFCIHKSIHRKFMLLEIVDAALLRNALWTRKNQPTSNGKCIIIM